MSMWKYNGGILNFQELKIKNIFESHPNQTKIGGTKSNIYEEEDESSF